MCSLLPQKGGCQPKEEDGWGGRGLRESAGERSACRGSVVAWGIPSPDVADTEQERSAGKRSRTSTGYYPHQALNLARLPIPPFPQKDDRSKRSTIKEYAIES